MSFREFAYVEQKSKQPMITNYIDLTSKPRPGWYQSCLLPALITLGILGLMVFLSLAAMLQVPPRAKLNSAKTEVDLVVDAVKGYQEEVGSYPPDPNALRLAPAGAPPGKWNGPYLNKDLPLDPWGHPYQYSCPGKHNPDSFDFWTVSPDGQQIGNWGVGFDRAQSTTLEKSSGSKSVQSGRAAGGDGPLPP